MKNIAIIGLGNIANKYLKGLDNSKFNLVCTIDKASNPKGLEYFLKYPLYQSLNEAVKMHQIDYLLISTPPKTHEEIILEALNLRINVLVEKIITLSKENYDNVINNALNNNLELITLYHWQYGDEALVINNYLNKNIKSITTNIYEPYCSKDGNMNEEYLNLGGPIIDSLPNVLSFYSLFLKLNSFKFIEKTNKKDINNHLVHSKLKYLNNNIEITINIDWTKNHNLKETTIIYDDLTKTIINHTTPKIITKDKVINFNNENRLEKHYINLFKNITANKLDNTNNIHYMLFDQIK